MNAQLEIPRWTILDRNRLPRHRFVEKRNVVYGPGHRAHVIETPRERSDSLAGNPSVRRLQPGDAAERSGNPDRPAGVRADGAEADPGRERDRRAAARAAADPRAVPRIARRPVVGVHVRDAVRELVEVGLPEENGARLAESRE